MKTVRLDGKNSTLVAEEVCEILRKKGSVVLIPTETVYGLIARADDPVSAERIFRLKHRSGSKRLGWFIGNWRNLEKYGVLLAPRVNLFAF